MAVLHALEQLSSRRRLHLVELRPFNDPRIDDSIVVRSTKMGKDGEGFDIRALRRKRAPHVARLTLQPFREPAT